MLKPKQVAELFGVTQKTVGRWGASGRIVMVRLPSGHRRFTEDSIKAYLMQEGMTDAQATEALRRATQC